MIWLGAAAVAVVLLYLLRPPARRLPVPSTLLWKRLVERTRKRRRWLRWLLSLLLSLLFVLLLVATLFRIEPRFGAVTDPVLLIDNTGSMGTQVGGDSDGSRLDRARSLARTLLEQSSGSMTVADLAGTLGPTSFGSLDEAARALDRIRWRPELPARLPALFLRSGLARERPVFLLTDRPDRWEMWPFSGSAPSRAWFSEKWTLVDVSSSAQNVGLVRFSTSPAHPGVLGDPANAAFLEILNGGSQAQIARLEVDVLSPLGLEDASSEPVRLLERDLEISSDSTWTGVLDLSRAQALAVERPSAGPLVLRATVTADDDQQPADDTAWLVLDEGLVAIDGSRRSDVRRWPRWLTRVLETSERLRVVSRSEPNAVRILNAAPAAGESPGSPCLVLPAFREAVELPLVDAALQVPGQDSIALPWTAVAHDGSGPTPSNDQLGNEGASEPAGGWLIGRSSADGSSERSTASVVLITAPDPATGCVHWRFDPEAAHLETRPEFPAVLETVLLALGTQRTRPDAGRPRDRQQVWQNNGWSPVDDATVGARLLYDERGLRVTAPLGPEVTRVLETNALAMVESSSPGPMAIRRIEADDVTSRSGSPWPRRTVLIGLLGLLLLFEAGTRLAGWTE